MSSIQILEISFGDTNSDLSVYLKSVLELSNLIAEHQPVSNH